MDGTLIKIKSSISRFLDQTIRAFEGALQTGELLSFRVIKRFLEIFLLITSYLSKFITVFLQFHLCCSLKHLSNIYIWFGVILLFFARLQTLGWPSVRNVKGSGNASVIKEPIIFSLAGSE